MNKILLPPFNETLVVEEEIAITFTAEEYASNDGEDYDLSEIDALVTASDFQETDDHKDFVTGDSIELINNYYSEVWNYTSDYTVREQLVQAHLDKLRLERPMDFHNSITVFIPPGTQFIITSIRFTTANKYISVKFKSGRFKGVKVTTGTWFVNKLNYK